MKRKWSIDELTRLAFVHAESDRREMADCDRGEYGKEQLELAEAMAAYRLKRWGKTSFETSIEACTTVPMWPREVTRERE